MRGRTESLRLGLTAAAAVCLAGCDSAGLHTSLTPRLRPATLQPPAPEPVAPSAHSQDLAGYYLRVQNELLTRDQLRIDGGGPDTPFSSDDLARNFEDIVFYNEYARGGGVTARGSSGRLSRWNVPVRINPEFGASVPQVTRDRDRALIDTYAARLSRLTSHSITTGSLGANFHVFIVGEDDRAFLLRRLVQLVPGISQAELDLFSDLPRSYYCLVAAVANSRAPNTYTRAIALIRAEHPDLMRRSCIHEEVAQGLGLTNDSPLARPSIFNDDDEFALLTNHDELLLTMLYDPRLQPGMTAEEARPFVHDIAVELVDQPLRPTY